MANNPPLAEMSNEIDPEHDYNDDDNDAAAGPADKSSAPKPKRLACIVCRKRKLRCDGIRPSCSTCARLGHSCAYDEVRRKSGPKRGYVKALEERLKQVETLLKTQDPATSKTDTAKTPPVAKVDAARAQETMTATKNNVPEVVDLPELTNTHTTATKLPETSTQWQFSGPNISPQPDIPLDTFDFNGGIDMSNNFSWEMIGLGLEEPLPPQETIDELHQIYFDKIHPSFPMIQKYRYLAAMNLAPNQRPPICLRYIIWTNAAAVADKYANLRDLFYQRARKYVEADYIKGFGEHLISVAHAQTHVLLAQYEFKMMYFPRAWMSTGSAVRLCQMMGLHRLDGQGLDVKQCLPPPRDWTEREERRRTFWLAFTEDRYASIGTGWPMTIDEKDILTNMPASDDAFDMSREEATVTLSDSMTPAGAGQLSSLGGVVLLATLFGRNLVHLHRPDADGKDHDLNGEFWKRHRNMDNILLNTSLCLPPHLKMPQGIASPNVIFTNMCIHTSTICLHQAAIFKADKFRLPSAVSSESKIRCITAANEIASTMRMISHMDLSTMNPFIAFCLYVAARVFVQYLKSRPDDSQTADSLRFLLAAMSALKRQNPLTESFLVQLDVDLEALGQRIGSLKSAFARNMDSPSTNQLYGMEGNDTGPKGIATYRNECHFMKMAGDDGNATTAPDIAESNDNTQRTTATMNIQGPWLGSEEAVPYRQSSTSTPASFPTSGRHLSAASPSGRTGTSNTSVSGLGATESNVSAHSPASTDRPTPQSQSSDRNNMNIASGTGLRNDSDAFQQRPPDPTVDNGSNIGNFFAPDAASTYGTGFTPFMTAETPGREGLAGSGSADKAMNSNTEFSGWADLPLMPGSNLQPALTPVSEGVLRTIMQMGPMESMDLGWDSNP